MKKHHTTYFAALVLGAGVLMASNVQAGGHHRERHPDLRLAVDIIGTILYAASPKTVVVAPQPTRTVIVTEPVCRPRTVIVPEPVCRPRTVVVSSSYCPAPVVYHRPAPVIHHRSSGHFDSGRGNHDRGRGNHVTVRHGGRRGR
ncbi:MAG: hypothetical protein GX617_15905 [Lentisphaerae bacterium]|mgnify:CR=1 FL=1|nr:hypothetical protein [Lentisphaerota bacterium]